MALIGIDFGEKHIGLAYSSENIFSEPVQSIAKSCAYDVIKTFCKTNTVDTIIVGLPTGRIAGKVKAFGNNLERMLGITVIFWDETLSSKKAAQKLIDIGASRKNRKRKEHASAAALILQSYIDETYEAKT